MVRPRIHGSRDTTSGASIFHGLGWIPGIPSHDHSPSATTRSVPCAATELCVRPTVHVVRYHPHAGSSMRVPSPQTLRDHIMVSGVPVHLLCASGTPCAMHGPTEGPCNARVVLLQHISSTAREGLRDMVPGVLMASTISRPSGSLDPRSLGSMTSG